MRHRGYLTVIVLLATYFFISSAIDMLSPIQIGAGTKIYAYIRLLLAISVFSVYMWFLVREYVFDDILPEFFDEGERTHVTAIFVLFLTIMFICIVFTSAMISLASVAYWPWLSDSKVGPVYGWNILVFFLDQTMKGALFDIMIHFPFEIPSHLVLDKEHVFVFRIILTIWQIFVSLVVFELFLRPTGAMLKHGIQKFRRFLDGL